MAVQQKNYTVHNIVGKKFVKKPSIGIRKTTDKPCKQYQPMWLVKWRRYKKPTWEPLKHFNQIEFVEEFNKKLERKLKLLRREQNKRRPKRSRVDLENVLSEGIRRSRKRKDIMFRAQIEEEKEIEQAEEAEFAPVSKRKRMHDTTKTMKKYAIEKLPEDLIQWKTSNNANGLRVARPQASNILKLILQETMACERSNSPDSQETISDDSDDVESSESEEKCTKIVSKKASHSMVEESFRTEEMVADDGYHSGSLNLLSPTRLDHRFTKENQQQIKPTSYNLTLLTSLALVHPHLPTRNGLNCLRLAVKFLSQSSLDQIPTVQLQSSHFDYPKKFEIWLPMLRTNSYIGSLYMLNFSSKHVIEKRFNEVTGRKNTRKLVALNGERIAQICFGEQFMLLLTKTGALWSWGSNKHGQLGIGTSAKYCDALSLIAQNVAFVAAGKRHAAYIDCSGQLFSWGSNSNFQLGLSNPDDTGNVNIFHKPTKVEQFATNAIVGVSCGSVFTAVLTASGQLYYTGGHSSQIYDYATGYVRRFDADSIKEMTYFKQLLLPKCFNMESDGKLGLASIHPLASYFIVWRNDEIYRIELRMKEATLESDVNSIKLSIWAPNEPIKSIYCDGKVTSVYLENGDMLIQLEEWQQCKAYRRIPFAVRRQPRNDYSDAQLSLDSTGAFLYGLEDNFNFCLHSQRFVSNVTRNMAEIRQLAQRKQQHKQKWKMRCRTI